MNNQITLTAAEKMRLTRNRLGLSLQDMSDKSGVRPNNICLIETGKTLQPLPATLKKLAPAYGFTTLEIMGMFGYLDEGTGNEES